MLQWVSSCHLCGDLDCVSHSQFQLAQPQLLRGKCVNGWCGEDLCLRLTDKCFSTFIPKHFIFLMLLWMKLFSWLFGGSLQVYKNKVYFCILVLDPATVLDSWILIFSRFLSILYKCCLQIDIMLFVFSLNLLFLITVFYTMLTRSAKSKHLCLFLHLWKSIYSFPVTVVTVGFCWRLFIRLRKFPSIPFHLILLRSVFP